MNYGRIGVLMGGPSYEREISIKSGMAVCAALRGCGHNVSPIEIPDAPIAQLYNYIISNSFKIDVAFIAMHGQFGEDGTIQSILEEAGIPYTGSDVKASRLGMDKVASRELFKKAGLNVPRYEVISREHWEKRKDNRIMDDGSWRIDIHHPLSTIPYPATVIVKPAEQGSSIGISVVETEDRLKSAIELVFKYDERVIIEEYIKGRELTVGILDEEALPVIEIIPSERIFDFECKYKKGLTEYITPAPIPEDIYALAQTIGLSSHNAIGARHFSRVDMIWKAPDIIILEINTIPGFTSTSLLPKAAKEAGLDFANLCEKLLELALSKKITQASPL